MTVIWRQIKRFVLSGKETAKVDLKLMLDLSGKHAKAEFAKDVMAIANTPGGDGYLIIGVQDEKVRTNSIDSNFIVGFQAAEGADALHRQMIDALSDFCNRVPGVEYDEIVVPSSDKTVGVVIIKRSNKRPHAFIKDGSGIQQNNIPIRRGTKTFPMASPDELQEMMQSTSALTVVTLVNLSGHPFTEEQQRQLANKDFYIEELIEVPAHFAKTAVMPQVDALLAEIDLSIEEWQTKRILLLPPGLSPIALALLACIHGLRGGFPDLVWIQPSPDHPGTFVVGEYIELQALRDAARELRIIEIHET